MGNNITKDKIKFQDELLHKINKVENLEASQEELHSLIKKPAHKLREELINNKDLKMTTILNHYHILKQEEQNEHNSLVEVIYDEAFVRCQQLDDLREKETINYQQKKLLGFYMSIKDCLKFKNTASTCGFYINLNKKCPKNERTVKHLIEQGVIFISKGNIPQGVFSMECKSNIFGKGLNPFDHNRTPGGSSGGDGALVRLGLVNCALGSDIAGSLRIPALFNGIVTLKPTVPRTRLDIFTEFFEFQDDHYNYPDFMTYLLPTIGPLTRTVEDCETLMEVMISDVKQDMYSPPLPWIKVDKLPKKIGYLKELDICEVSPANKRALMEAKSILEKQGVEVIELDLDKEIRELYILALAIYWQVPTLNALTTGKTKLRESLVSDFKEISLLLKTPKIFYPFIKKILKYFGQDRMALSLVAADLSKSVNNSYLTRRRFQLYEKVVKKMNKLKIECFLSYGLATPAITHGSFNEVYMQSLYTFMFNFLNFPAGVVPVTKVRKEEQVYESKFDDLITKGMKKVMQNSEGLPIGVQVAGISWKDELVIRVMREIEKGVNENFDCPFQKKFEKN